MPKQTTAKVHQDTLPIEQLTAEVQKIIHNEGKRDEKLMQICILLHEKIDKFDWVGFYLVDHETDRELVLGPYVGEETNHTRIPFGTGICGQAAETRKTFVIDDVEAESNYLSCGVAVKSEIVIPIIKDGVFIGELDIDSHTKAAITSTDREVLEAIAKLTEGLF